MSWDQYVTNLEGKKVDRCGIHGKDGNPWAEARGFHLPCEEVTKVKKIIEDKDDNVFGTGIELAGEKWTVIRRDEGKLVLKGKKECCKKNMVICVTNQTVIVGGNTDENVSCQEVCTAVEGMGSYLCQNGY